MINKSNITTLFKALDEALGQKNEKREITVFGSGPLIANDIIDRATVDTGGLTVGLRRAVAGLRAQHVIARLVSRERL